MSSAESEFMNASAPAQSGVLLQQPVHAATTSNPETNPELLLPAFLMAREPAPLAAELSPGILQQGDYDFKPPMRPLVQSRLCIMGAHCDH